MAYLDVQYRILQQGGSTILVLDNSDVEGLTDLVWSEPGHKDQRITLSTDDLAALIEALKRRYQDAKGVK